MRLIGLAAVVAIIVIPLLFAYLAHMRNTRNAKLKRENKMLRLTLAQIEEDAASTSTVGNVETQLNYAETVTEQIRNLRRKELS